MIFWTDMFDLCLEMGLNSAIMSLNGWYSCHKGLIWCLVGMISSIIGLEFNLVELIWDEIWDLLFICESPNLFWMPVILNEFVNISRHSCDSRAIYHAYRPFGPRWLRYFARFPGSCARLWLPQAPFRGIAGHRRCPSCGWSPGARRALLRTCDPALAPSGPRIANEFDLVAPKEGFIRALMVRCAKCGR